MQGYPAKLLLFGEHVLLLGASALAVPVPGFSITPVWGPKKTDHPELRAKLIRFAESMELRSVQGMDADAFARDLAGGLHFDSNIPVGYGLGSSGALCAAVYDLYCREKSGDPAELKATFSRMESFFHGASSGIDPLTSYLGKPLLIRRKTEVEIARILAWDVPPLVFLLDTGLERQTGPLVQWFLEQNRRAAFAEKIERELLPAHESMVSGWLNARENEFWPALKRVSAFQLEYFRPMIPEALRPLWLESLKNDDFCLKICGAGGGGFILGFARHHNAAGFAVPGFPVVFPFESAAAEHTDQ